VTGEVVPAFQEQSVTDVLSAFTFVPYIGGFGQHGVVYSKGRVPQYTRIYINGRGLHVHPLGYVSQARMPLHFFEKFSYGSSLTGAEMSAVNLETHVNKYTTPYSFARFTFGSFESSIYGMDLTRAITNDLGFYLSGQYYKTAGYRDNTDGQMMSVYSNVYYNRFLPVRLDIHYINNEYGFPNSQQVPLNGRQTDHTFDIAGTVGIGNSAAVFFYDYQNIDYVDTANGKSFFVRTDQFGALFARHDTAPGVTIDYGASGFLTALDGGSYLPTRLSKADIWAQAKIKPGRFFVNAGALIGMANHHATFLCPKAEFGVSITGSLNIRAAFSRDVRLPSDFERWAPFDTLIPYFTIAGNSVLEPEYCIAGEVGIRGEGLVLNFYRLAISNYITIDVDSGHDPQYVNLNARETSGLEGFIRYPLRMYSADSSVMTEFSFAGGFNALIAGDSIPNVPIHSAGAIVSVSRIARRFSFGIALRSEFSGARHDIYGEEHDGFSVYSLAALVKFLSLSCVVRLNNVFDEAYAYRPNYPVAPRNYDVSVKWEFWD
jgi:outer membrane cobalamin receptor